MHMKHEKVFVVDVLYKSICLGEEEKNIYIYVGATIHTRQVI